MLNKDDLRQTLTFSLACTPDLVQQARQLEARTFREQGYVNYYDPDGLSEYRAYDSVSDFFVAMKEDRVIGMMRRIRPSDAGLPTLKDFTILPEWTGLLEQALYHRCVDEIGTAAVDAESRGKDGFAIFRGLWRATWHDSLFLCIRWRIFSLDYRVVRLLQMLFRLDLQPLGDGKFYMGSMTYPMAVDIHKELLSVRSKAPDIADYLLRGMDDARLEAVLKAARRCNEGNGMSV